MAFTFFSDKAKDKVVAAAGSDDPLGNLLPAGTNSFRLQLRAALAASRPQRFPSMTQNPTVAGRERTGTGGIVAPDDAVGPRPPGSPVNSPSHPGNPANSFTDGRDNFFQGGRMHSPIGNMFGPGSFNKWGRGVNKPYDKLRRQGPPKPIPQPK